MLNRIEFTPEDKILIKASQSSTPQKIVTPTKTAPFISDAPVKKCNPLYTKFCPSTEPIKQPIKQAPISIVRMAKYTFVDSQTGNLIKGVNFAPFPKLKPRPLALFGLFNVPYTNGVYTFFENNFTVSILVSAPGYSNVVLKVVEHKGVFTVKLNKKTITLMPIDDYKHPIDPLDDGHNNFPTNPLDSSRLRLARAKAIARIRKIKLLSL